MTEGKYEASGPGLEKASFKMKVNHQEVPFTIERPDIIHGATNGASEAIILAPGWTETEDSLKPLRHQIAKLGLAAVTLYHPRVVRPDKVMKGAQLRVDNITGVSNFLASEYFGVHAFGHSLGGIDLTRSKFEQQAPYKSMVLSNSAGLIDSDHFQHVAPRFFKMLLLDEYSIVMRAPLSSIGFIKESVSTVIQNPFLAASEGLAAATHYVGRHINEISESGTVTANLMADQDHIFPHSLVLENTKNINFDDVRVFKDSCHNLPSHLPSQTALYVANIALNSANILADRQNNKAIA